jgi:tetratricopeptide (TPR) repeat protein
MNHLSPFLCERSEHKLSFFSQKKIIFGYANLAGILLISIYKYHFSLIKQLKSMKSTFLSLLLVAFTTTIFAQNDPIEEGVKLHDEGKYAEAIKKFEEALKADAKNMSANYEMANTYNAMQEYDKAIKFADKVIASKSESAGGAYMIKGTAYDMQKKPKKAIEAYMDGIKFAPNVHLLYFNLGVTYMGIKEYDEAEKALINSVTRKPSHASSHFILGYVCSEKKSKVKSLLALYNFLILEPKSKRSKMALGMIEDLLGNSVKKKDNGFDMTITLDDNEKDETFRSADLYLSMSKAVEMSADKALKDSLGVTLAATPAISFKKSNENLFQYLGEVKEKEKGFWWKYYAQFFADVEKNGFTEVLSYYMRLSKEEKEVTEWLDKNKEKVQKFSDWYKKYERKMN